MSHPYHGNKSAGDLFFESWRKKFDLLPGFRAWHSMQPELAFGRHQGPAPSNCARAGVLILFFLKQAEPYFAILQRAEGFGLYPGHMGLPGGMTRADETPREAAFREAEEELGLPRLDMNYLGKLTPVYLFGGNIEVLPFAAYLQTSPEWRLDEREVRALFEVPLALLVDNGSKGLTERTLHGVSFRAPCWNIGASPVWGGTALILAELAAVLADRQGDYSTAEGYRR